VTVNNRISAELGHKAGFCCASGNANHRQTLKLGELHQGTSNTTRSGMDKNSLSRTDRNGIVEQQPGDLKVREGDHLSG